MKRPPAVVPFNEPMKRTAAFGVRSSSAIRWASSYVTAWVYRRVDRGTVRWMVPLLLWMPTTTLLKLITL